MSPSVIPKWYLRDEFLTTNGVIFAGERIVIPVKLCPYLLAMLHESHFGMEKTKARVCHVMYWPEISKDIKVYASFVADTKEVA